MRFEGNAFIVNVIWHEQVEDKLLSGARLNKKQILVCFSWRFNIIQWTLQYKPLRFEIFL